MTEKSLSDFKVPLLTFDSIGNPLMDGKELSPNAKFYKLSKEPNTNLAVLTVDYYVWVQKSPDNKSQG